MKVYGSGKSRSPLNPPAKMVEELLVRALVVDMLTSRGHCAASTQAALLIETGQ